jgi:hypothetical protein
MEVTSQGMLDACALSVTEHNLSHIQEAQHLQFNFNNYQTVTKKSLSH